MAKSGTEFELFSKELYEEILGEYNLKNLEVKHDVRLKGATGQLHQIDVYWAFEVGGVVHKVAVECKDYANAVTVGRIRDFSAALDDIGDIKGIFLTRAGYQSGAKVFAKGKGIALKTVQTEDITAEDFIGSGRVTSAHIIHKVCRVENIDFYCELDEEKSGDDTTNIRINHSGDEIFILDKDKVKLWSVNKLTNELPREPENTQRLVFRKDFSHGLFFLDFPSNQIELKIKAIRFIYDTETSCTEYFVSTKATAKAIIRDILSNTCEVVSPQRLD